jgi:fructokinase
MARIGIDLGGTKIEALALAADGRELARIRIATPRADYSGTIRVLHGLVSEIEQKAGLDPCPVGIGIPGAIDPATGLVKNANSTWLNGKPFDRDVAAALKRPLRLANDANCLAVSEATDGAGAGLPIVFGAILGTGVGGGIAIDGKVLVGANANSGEWGHVALPWMSAEEQASADPCYCGLRGCIETWLSGPGLARDHRRVTGQSLDGPAIIALATSGDAAALATLARYEDRLARALAMIVNVLDPGMIVLGGGLGQIDRLYHTVPGLMAGYCFSKRIVTRLAKPKHGDSSGVRGAAWLWP